MLFLQTHQWQMDRSKMNYHQCLPHYLCALKWHSKKLPQQNDKKDLPRMLEPNTMNQHLKELFITFKAKNIQYSYKTDFNGNSEYQGVLKAL